MDETHGSQSQSGLRKTLVRWRARFRKVPNSKQQYASTAASISPSVSTIHTESIPHKSSREVDADTKTTRAGAPALVFTPTTRTSIYSPLDPRTARAHANAQSKSTSNSNSSSPASTLKKRPPNSRRNTAPADYFPSSQPHTRSSSRQTTDRTIMGRQKSDEEMKREIEAVISPTTMTTTITANAQRPARLRHRLSFARQMSLRV